MFLRQTRMDTPNTGSRNSLSRLGLGFVGGKGKSSKHNDEVGIVVQ